MIHFVHANLAIEDPNATLQEAREVQFGGALSAARRPGSGKGVVETRNLADLREAVAVCAEQGCSLTQGLVRGLHRRLMEGVSEAPGDHLKPGEFRGPADEHRFTGIKCLKKHRSVSWRVRMDVNALLEGTENESWPQTGVARRVASFTGSCVYTPSATVTGGWRALSTLLLARDLPEVLLVEKPVGEVILEHREDYVNVLEHCDAIYEDLAEADVPEGARLRRCELPFSDFYARAVSMAYYEHLRKAHAKPPRTNPALAEKPPPEMNLNFEAIRASNP